MRAVLSVSAHAASSKVQIKIILLKGSAVFLIDYFSFESLSVLKFCVKFSDFKFHFLFYF